MEIAREQAEKAHKEIQEAFAAQHKHPQLWPDKPVAPRNQSPQFNSQPRPEPNPMDLDRIVQSVLSQVNAKVEEAVAKALSELERKKRKQEKSGFDPFENETEEQGNSF